MWRLQHAHFLSHVAISLHAYVTLRIMPCIIRTSVGFMKGKRQWMDVPTAIPK